LTKNFIWSMFQSFFYPNSLTKQTKLSSTSHSYLPLASGCYFVLHSIIVQYITDLFVVCIV